MLDCRDGKRILNSVVRAFLRRMQVKICECLCVPAVLMCEHLDVYPCVARLRDCFIYYLIACAIVYIYMRE